MKISFAPFFRLAALSLAALGAMSCQSTTPPDRFAKADRDGSGALSPAEITEFLVVGIFDARDTNRDGKITRAEWNPQMDATEAREFSLRDADSDGAVTREEAVAYATRTGVYAADIRAADSNKDGQVSLAEARAYYASKE